MREKWIDHQGKYWSVVRSSRPLRFKLPSHAALRAFIFHRDRYRCRRCAAAVVAPPAEYDGRRALYVDTKTGAGTQDVLVLDHIRSLRAGGRSVPGNLQALCETCNRRKQKQDKADAAAMKRAV